MLPEGVLPKPCVKANGGSPPPLVQSGCSSSSKPKISKSGGGDGFGGVRGCGSEGGKDGGASCCAGGDGSADGSAGGIHGGSAGGIHGGSAGGSNGGGNGDCGSIVVSEPAAARTEIDTGRGARRSGAMAPSLSAESRDEACDVARRVTQA